MYLKIISGVFLLGLVNGQRDQHREGKWIFYPRTKTSFVYERSLITELLPSSCVAVLPSLPPCRHVRQLDIRPNPTEKIEITASPELLAAPTRGLAYGPRSIFSSNGHQENRETQDNSQRPLTWGEFLGLEDVTVTKTAVQSVTTKYYDPNTIVTYVVKGCRPSRLPFDLPPCNNSASFNTPSGLVAPNSTATADGAGTTKATFREVPYLP